MIIQKVRGKNFLSVGNAFLEFDIQQYSRTVISGKNGSAKCLRKNSNIDIKIDDEEILKLYEEFIYHK